MKSLLEILEEVCISEDGIGVAGSGSTPTMSADIATHGEYLKQGKNIPFPKLKLKKKKKGDYK